MKGLIFLLSSLLLVGVQCRPAEPEVRHFGVQPDNPNVKVFFTYPTVPPRIDNPNDLEKGTQNEEKEKYVKDVLKEAVKAKGEGLSKESDKEAPVATETLTEVNANDQQPTLLDDAIPEASSSHMQEDLPTKGDTENEKPFMKSKDFASQITPTENLLGGFIVADTINGEEDLDSENLEEAREDVDQEGSITINQFPSAASEISPGLPELISPIEGDEEVSDNGESEGTIVIPLSSEPLSDISTAEADFTRNSENDDEAIENSHVTPTSLNERNGGPPAFGISVIYPDEEGTAALSPMEDAEPEMPTMPIAAEEASVRSGVPLIPVGVEILPVVEVMEMSDSTKPQMAPEMENNPEEGLTEMLDDTEPNMDPIAEVPARVLNTINVEVMPSENIEDSPMMFEEFNPEMDESLVAEEKLKGAMTANEALPSPVAEVEPNVNMPIADVDEIYMANNEGIQLRAQEEDEAFLDYMSETDDKLMAGDLAAAPQTPDRLMPVIEADVPMDSDLPASDVTRESGSMIDEHNVDPITEPLEDEMIVPVEQTPKVDETPAVESEITNNEEVSPNKELTPKETELKVTEKLVSPVEAPASDAILATEIKPEEAPVETKSTDGESKVEVTKEIKTDKNPKDSEIVVPEPETLGKMTTPSAPAVDPIELALQNENYSSDDDTFLNETL